MGDQFAMMEAVVTLSLLIRRFEFELATKPEDVGFYTGATIHTRNGLYMKFRRRVRPGTGVDSVSSVPEPAKANSSAIPA